MLVFGTQLHIITFLITLFEMVFFCYQVVFYLSRPTDKNRLYYLILLFLLIQYNVLSGLLPDKNISINIILQSVISYSATFAMAMYFPYYFYKAFDLKQLKFYAFWGSVVFLLIPFIVCFVIPYYITGNLEISRRMVVIIPFFYALSFLYSLVRAIQAKNKENQSSNKEVIAVLIGFSFWILLPIIAFFDSNISKLLAPFFPSNTGSQVVEVIDTNCGLLIMTVIFIRRSVKQSRDEYNKLLDSERQLLELNNDLHNKVKERTKALELLNEQRTNTFINLTHETKTPLTLINNYLDEYIKKYGESSELRIIKSSTEKLSRDIVNLFDIERFKRGDYAFNNEQTANFSNILKNNIALFKPFALTKQIEVIEKIEDNLLIKADPESICRVINNLIENAIKYTPEKGIVEVTLEGTGQNLNFKVKDNGIGIPFDLRNKIFEPYYQINREKKNYQGMGMGLAIVKHIIDSLKGTINLSSNDVNHGTEIAIELHDWFKGEEELSNKNIEHKKLYFQDEKLYTPIDFNENKRTILIVEDNIALLNFIACKIGEIYNVQIATNGLEALEKLKTIKHLDLIVSDVMMDKINGFEFYKAFSTNDRLKHIPFIFITAKSTLNDKLYGLDLGAIDYIQKPFLIDELIKKIDAILNNFEKQRLALINEAFKSLINNNQPVISTVIVPAIDDFEKNCVKYNLTNREVEIVKSIAKGSTYKSIADELFISDKTVAKHIQNIFEKTSVTNKLELLNKLKHEAFELSFSS